MIPMTTESLIYPTPVTDFSTAFAPGFSHSVTYGAGPQRSLPSISSIPTDNWSSGDAAVPTNNASMSTPSMSGRLSDSTSSSGTEGNNSHASSAASA